MTLGMEEGREGGRSDTRDGGREGGSRNTHTSNLLSGSLGSFDRFFRNACGSLTATLAGPMVLLPTFFFWVSSFTEELNLDTCLGREGEYGVRGAWKEQRGKERNSTRRYPVLFTALTFLQYSQLLYKGSLWPMHAVGYSVTAQF